jgi:hypothetical protein
MEPTEAAILFFFREVACTRWIFVSRNVRVIKQIFP